MAASCSSCCGGGDPEPSVTATPEPQIPWFRFAIGLVFAGQGMVFGLGWNTTPVVDRPAFGSIPYILIHAGLAFSVIVVTALLGGPLLRRTWQAWRRGRMTLESLFVLSAAGAFTGSVLSSLTGVGALYYEVVAILMVVYTFGQSLKAKQRAEVDQELARLRDDFRWAWIRGDDGSRHRVPLAELADGFTDIVVAPGEPITVDGVIVEGEALVQETALTGEPAPVHRRVGDAVYAGTYAVDGDLRLRLSNGWGDRRLDAILAAVESAEARPTRWQRFADRLMQWFVPVVIVIAVSTFSGWLLAGQGWAEALFAAMAVLLVACPCALGLATPLAVWTGLGRLQRMGIVARAASFLDDLAAADTVIFDKTGTLSEGELRLAGWRFAPAWADRAADLRHWVATAERGLPHPVARALERAEEDDLAADAGRLATRRLEPGLGLTATVLDADGRPRDLRIGQAALFPAEAREALRALQADDLPEAAKAVVGVTVDGVAVALIFLAERLRPDAAETLAAFRDEGLAVEIYTGDPEPAWEAISGARVHAGLDPAEKARRLRALRDEGRHLLFVGDGLNDAAAMADSTAAVALDSGAALTRATAPAVLMGERLAPLREARALARATQRVLRGNLLFAAAYNFVGIGLAAAGWLHPVVAALLMVGSSAWVSTRALSIVYPKKGPKLTKSALPQGTGAFTSSA